MLLQLECLEVESSSDYKTAAHPPDASGGSWDAELDVAAELAAAMPLEDSKQQAAAAAALAAGLARHPRLRRFQLLSESVDSFLAPSCVLVGLHLQRFSLRVAVEMGQPWSSAYLAPGR